MNKKTILEALEGMSEFQCQICRDFLLNTDIPHLRRGDSFGIDLEVLSTDDLNKLVWFMRSILGYDEMRD